MKFYMWADKESDLLGPIRDTARAYGITPEIIGEGAIIEPRGEINESSDFVFKIFALKEAVSKLKDDEIVCCTDAFDVLYQDNEDAIREKFLSFNCDIVYSAEKLYSNQYRGYRGHFDKRAKTAYRYVNAGGVIGYARAIRTMLGTITSEKRFMENADEPKAAERLMRNAYEGLLSLGAKTIGRSPLRGMARRLLPNPGALKYAPRKISGKFSDQTRIGQYVATNPDNLDIRLDYGCKIFWCIAGEWDDIESHYEVKNKRITNKNTGSSPSFIHVVMLDKYPHILAGFYGLIMGKNR